MRRRHGFTHTLRNDASASRKDRSGRYAAHRAGDRRGHRAGRCHLRGDAAARPGAAWAHPGQAAGVIAGLPVVEAVFRRVDPALGLPASRPATGPAWPRATWWPRWSARRAGMLAAERTALNFLQRLSGIATLTRGVRRGRGGHPRRHPRHPQDPPRATACWKSTPCAWAAGRTTAWACTTCC